MKNFVLIFLAFICLSLKSFAMDDKLDLRDYSQLVLSQGTFIPVISTQEISTANYDVGDSVKFITTTDLFLSEINVIPQNSYIYGSIEKINEPIVGTNASMIIRVSKLVFSDGFEMPMRGYIYTPNGNLIGGEITEPACYEKKLSMMQGYPALTGYVPGATRKVGEHKVIAAGADLIVVLVAPLYVTHTVIN